MYTYVQKAYSVSLMIQTGVFYLVIKMMKYDVPNNNLALLDTYNEKIDVVLCQSNKRRDFNEFTVIRFRQTALLLHWDHVKNASNS